MPTLTANQVAGVIIDIGPPAGTTVAEWVTVARKESGFSTDIEDYLGSGHIGLWQISVDHYTKAPTQVSKEEFRKQLENPTFNFMMAKAVYLAAGGWSPWKSSIGTRPVPSAADMSAANNPDKSASTPGGLSASLGNLIPGNPLDALTAPIDALKAIVEPVLAAAKWIGNPGNWIRVVQVVGGIALGLVAVALVLQPAVSEVKRAIK
jgi:hypothetical protein